MQIILQSSSTHVLNVSPTTTISSLHSIISSSSLSPTPDYFLTSSSGKPLSCTSSTLSTYDLRPNSVVLLHPRRRGGELVFYFIMIVFAIAFGVPILSYIYRKYVYKIIETAAESVANARKRTTERMSGAGRRVTSNRLSGRFK